MFQVNLIELTRPSPSLPEILTGIGNTVVGADRMLKQLVDGLALSNGIMFEKLDGSASSNPILTMMKDYLSSLQRPVLGSTSFCKFFSFLDKIPEWTSEMLKNKDLKCVIQKLKRRGKRK